MAPTKKTNKRAYTAQTIKEALRCVKESVWSLYKANKQYAIPWSTLKDYAKKYLEDPASASI